MGNALSDTSWRFRRELDGLCSEYQQASDPLAQDRAIARILQLLEECPQHIISIEDSFSALTKLAQLGTTCPLETAIAIAQCVSRGRAACSCMYPKASH